MDESVLWLLYVIAGTTALPTALTVYLARRHAGAWDPLPGLPARVAGGAYRSSTVATAPRRGAAPAVVQCAAWSCFLFGQAAVPGAVIGLFGLLAFGIGLLAVPGLVVSYRLLGVGAAMLRRAPGAAEDARSVARFSAWLNVAILAVIGFTAALAGATSFVLAAVYLCVPYALASLGQAWLVYAAAAALSRAERTTAGAIAHAAPAAAVLCQPR